MSPAPLLDRPAAPVAPELDVEAALRRMLQDVPEDAPACQIPHETIATTIVTRIERDRFGLPPFPSCSVDVVARGVTSCTGESTMVCQAALGWLLEVAPQTYTNGSHVWTLKCTPCNRLLGDCWTFLPV